MKNKESKQEFLRIVVQDGRKPYYSIEYMEGGKCYRGYGGSTLEEVRAYKRKYFDYAPKVGDEVENENGTKCVITGINKEFAHILYSDGSNGTTELKNLWATGYHLNSVDRLLKDMKDKKESTRQVVPCNIADSEVKRE